MIEMREVSDLKCFEFPRNPAYVQHNHLSNVHFNLHSFQHWQIPLSKRFRSLKLWFVIRNYGVKGLQKHIREGVRLAQKFEAIVLADNRFEIPATRHLGEYFEMKNLQLVSFR